MTPTANEAAATYCYLGGVRVPLTPAPGLVALKMTHRVPLTEKAAELLRSRAEPVEFIPGHGVNVYRFDTSVNALEAFRAEPAVDFASRVFLRSNNQDDLMFADNRFIVQFKPEMDEAQIRAMNAQYGATIVERRTYAPNLYVLEAPQGQDAIALANRYHESGKVLSAEPNLIRQPHYKASSLMPADVATLAAVIPRDYLAQQWHLTTAKVVDAWNITRGEPSIRVAILDDGVDTGHPEFIGKVVAQYDFESHTADGNPKTSSEKHGTSCAGVAVAAGVNAYGAAPRCSLVAIHSPNYLGIADEGIMFQKMVDEFNADIISCSWGPADGTGNIDPLPSATGLAIRYCMTNGRGGKGIPIFWAAGNGNEIVSTDGYASNPDVMAIAASTDHDTKSWYSDFGPEICICAPSSGNRNSGERAIFTTDRRGAAGYNPGLASAGDAAGDYTNSFGGTSSAAPLAAGIAALMLSANPNLTAQQVRTLLMATTDKIGGTSAYDSAGHSDIYGSGRVNALAAVQRARGGTNSGGGPSIQGPASVPRSGGPPTFQVSPAPNQYYVVEFATQSSLFDNANQAQRSASNFYGSWQDSPFLTASTYAMPQPKWDALKGAAQIFYRIFSSSSNTSWVNTQSSVSNIANAPSVQVTGGTSGGSGPSINGASTVPRSGGPPAFQVTPGSNPYYVVEFATQTSLFDSSNQAQRNASNFYGTWQDTPFLTASSYTMPQAKWDLLKAANQILYRILTSSSNTAWVNLQSSSPNIASAPSFQILAGSSGSGSGPSISGPSSVSRSAAPPAFQVNPAPNQYYVVAFATQTSLFDNANQSQRTASNFYGSWQDSPFQSAAAYTMPQAKWDALRAASQLYYRIWTSSTNTSWVNVQGTTPGSFQITAGKIEDRIVPAPKNEVTSPSMPRSESPFIIGPERYGVDAQEPPTFHLELGRNRYWAVEVATDANLFNGGNRNDSTFFDSWRRGLRRTDSPTTYTLPPEAWDALRGTNPPRLYYRLLTAAADDARWPGLETSLPTGDLGHAPYITLTRGLARKIIGESVSNLRNRNEAQWRDPV